MNRVAGAGAAASPSQLAQPAPANLLNGIHRQAANKFSSTSSSSKRKLSTLSTKTNASADPPVAMVNKLPRKSSQKQLFRKTSTGSSSSQQSNNSMFGGAVAIEHKPDSLQAKKRRSGLSSLRHILLQPATLFAQRRPKSRQQMAGPKLGPQPRPKLHERPPQLTMSVDDDDYEDFNDNHEYYEDDDEVIPESDAELHQNALYPFSRPHVADEEDDYEDELELNASELRLMRRLAISAKSRITSNR